MPEPTGTLHIHQGLCILRYCETTSHCWSDGEQQIIQHGSNEEHRFYAPLGDDLMDRVVEWYNRLHDHEGRTQEAARTRRAAGEPEPRDLADAQYSQWLRLGYEGS